MARKLLDILKPKPKQKEKPPNWLFRVFVVFLIILALNVSHLYPPQLGALLFQIEMMALQFLNYPLLLHRWELFTIIILAGVYGIYLTPTVYVPTEKKTYVYIRTWREGSIRYFKTLSGYYIAVNDDLVKQKWLRWTVIGRVKPMPRGNTITLQTDWLEVSHELLWKYLAEDLMDMLKQHRGIIRNSGIILEKDTAVDLMKSKPPFWNQEVQR